MHQTVSGSGQTKESVAQLCGDVDNAGGRNKILLLAGDGKVCNRTCFGQIPERSVLLVRARKDAKLCYRALACEPGLSCVLSASLRRSPMMGSRAAF
jgi:hypothetical protein